MKTIEKIAGSFGREIALRHWRIRHQQPRLVVVLSHGMGEHIDRYDPFAQFCNSKDIVVLGLNHRGHGEETSHLGHFDDEQGWIKLLGDLDNVVDFAHEQYACPVVLLGHSMGSFAARHYAMLQAVKLSGLILCGSDYRNPPLFRLASVIASTEVKLFGKRHPSWLMEVLSFGSFNLRVSKPRTRYDWLNRVDSEVDKYIKDPFCGGRSSAQFWVDFMSALAWSSKPSHLKLIPQELPVLIASGDADPVSRMGKGAEALTNALSSAGLNSVVLKLYPEARHELLLEQNRTEIYQDIYQWLEQSNILEAPVSETCDKKKSNG